MFYLIIDKLRSQDKEVTTTTTTATMMMKILVPSSWWSSSWCRPLLLTADQTISLIFSASFTHFFHQLHPSYSLHNISLAQLVRILSKLSSLSDRMVHILVVTAVVWSHLWPGLCWPHSPLVRAHAGPRLVLAHGRGQHQCRF